ncbi:hypothetical protein O0L34_g1939 [Tuta absoluta]|nr:hypothetical protein O0L34_g1939 [Tuta absoluta]
MSIKSQKSLYEECSEIVEASYSVRSYSDDSFSCDDEEECLARELMNKLTPAVLSKLRRCFKKSNAKKQAADIDSRVEEVMRLAAAEEGIEFAAALPFDDPLWLDEDGFVTALDGIFGHHKYTTHAHKLFQLLDSFNTGRVKWRQLVDRLVAVGAKRTGTRADVWTPVLEKTVERLEHCKRETIIKLVSMERTDSFCYAAVSKGGRVGIYSGSMQLIHSYEVFYHRTGTRRRVRNCWITDAVYLADVQCLVVSASDRSLTIYDSATLTHTPIFCITGLPNIPTCLCYSPANRSGSSSLALGTERGDVIRLVFLQPRVSLFFTKTNEHINYYFWMELITPPHTSYCSIQTYRRLHSRSIRRVAYAKDGELLASCSHDSNISVRLKHVPGKLGDYVFKVQRGVTCFHIVPSLHLLATGSCDGIVRLWETTQNIPFASLSAPGQAAVLDVAVVAAKEIVIGYCSNCWLHIWDLYEECLLQTVKVKFPFLGVLGRKAEFGAYCIHPGPARKKLSDDDSDTESDDDPQAPDLEATTSRRASSVYQGSTGGLILQTEDHKRTNHALEDDKEFIRFNRPEVLITCCDYVYLVQLARNQDGRASPLPPPGDTLRAKRPSFWDLPDDVFKEPPISPKPPPSPISPPEPNSLSTPHRSSIPSSMLLSPAMAEFAVHDLDTLLENAGLQGILEKDFVLMRGLKHDLNKKLADMKANMTSMTSAVSMCAPYLALKFIEPEPVTPADEMLDRYREIMKLFPESSLAATPTTSNQSTPRKRNSTQPNIK